MSRARVGVLISGRGSNMEALIEASRDPECPYEVVLVLSDNPDAAGLARARELGVEAKAIDRRLYGKDREAHEKIIDEALRLAGAQYVALAGYMRILTPFLVGAWKARMVNIHPSLLPKYPGLDTHKRALEAGDTEAGCTVHLVTNDLDCGPILGQARVPVLPGDDEEALRRRVLAEEHRLYPAALAALIRSSH
ncbi:MAG TPA: phosphoribosylglycinamide formyltransferase [Caulobacteraceae bacterium]